MLHRRKAGLRLFAPMLLVWPLSAGATEYWTIKAEGGVLVNNTGTAAINSGSYQPTGANPPGSIWDCDGNWVYFHKKADGSVVDPIFIDRMLATALSAFKSGSRIRIGIDRSADGKCWTSALIDMGS